MEERSGLIRRLLIDNPIHQKLDDRGQSGVRSGILRELVKFDRNSMLTGEGVEEYKIWFLRERVPNFLGNMLDGQVANERLASRRPSN